tara:strand:+ start:550 stop:900 length:351 start_codon:yes stop_codon:yes gene_type:complete
MSPKKKTTKKVIQESAPAPKKSHDWLPDNFVFGNGVTACWAERRQEPKGSHLQWIVIHSEKELPQLDKTWNCFVEDARKSGLYIEFKGPKVTNQLWPIPPLKRESWKTLPYSISFV